MFVNFQVRFRIDKATPHKPVLREATLGVPSGVVGGQEFLVSRKTRPTS